MISVNNVDHNLLQILKNQNHGLFQVQQSFNKKIVLGKSVPSLVECVWPTQSTALALRFLSVGPLPLSCVGNITRAVPETFNQDPYL